jgi:hypothetical protein
MYIIEVSTQCRKKVVIMPIEPEDLLFLTRKRYSFSWKSLRHISTIYKLLIEGEEDILGVMALVDFPFEKRTEIRLLASSVENQGRNKKYDRIAGCLIGFACSQAKLKYLHEACVSLVPKTELVSHYMEKYQMQNAGWQLYLDDKKLNDLLKEYYHEL